MSANNLKKMIVFSNERTKKIVARMVADQALMEKCSCFSIIESCLLSDDRDTSH